jgi:hypothetical protein
MSAPKNPNQPGPRQDNGRGPHYTTWLLIRYQSGDVGDRPLAPGAVFWESPDVWTEGSQGINQPVPGEPTKVFTRISNLGMQDAYGVTVKYWWANPAIAISEATANLIATDSVTVPAGNIVQFQSPVDWTPIVENGGHECLLVEAFIPFFDDLTTPMQPLFDRHVGQKNEQLVMLQQGQQFHFQVDAFNFTQAQQDVVVEARPGLIPRELTRRFARRGLWTTEIFDPPDALPVNLSIAREPYRNVQSRGTLGQAQGNALDCLGPAQVTQTRNFRPGDIYKVDITGGLPATAKRGEVYVVRIFQRIGAVLSGGYTLFVTLAPPHAPAKG